MVWCLVCPALFSSVCLRCTAMATKLTTCATSLFTGGQIKSTTQKLAKLLRQRCSQRWVIFTTYRGEMNYERLNAWKPERLNGWTVERLDVSTSVRLYDSTTQRLMSWSGQATLFLLLKTSTLYPNQTVLFYSNCLY